MTSNRISDPPSNKPDDAVDQPLEESAGDGAGVGVEGGAHRALRSSGGCLTGIYVPPIGVGIYFPL